MCWLEKRVGWRLLVECPQPLPDIYWIIPFCLLWLLWIACFIYFFCRLYIFHPNPIYCIIVLCILLVTFKRLVSMFFEFESIMTLDGFINLISLCNNFIISFSVWCDLLIFSIKNMLYVKILFHSSKETVSFMDDVISNAKLVKKERKWEKKMCKFFHK